MEAGNNALAANTCLHQQLADVNKNAQVGVIIRDELADKLADLEAVVREADKTKAEERTKLEADYHERFLKDARTNIKTLEEDNQTVRQELARVTSDLQTAQTTAESAKQNLKTALKDKRSTSPRTKNCVKHKSSATRRLRSGTRR
ncbi:MAG: hypothetical protein Alis3KO_41270 [Aliiglaciecola sp.]